MAAWGSDYLAQLLRHIGLDYVALNPGASFRGLHDSLVNVLGDRAPQMLTVLHEEHAVAIAHGYAKVLQRPMGAILHANVGLMHASMALFDAWCDRVPVLAFGATGPVDAARRRPWIDWIHTAKDQAALVRPFLKWDAQPASLEAARDDVLRARQIATTLPCGPTYVCFDSDLQEAEAPATLPPLPAMDRHRSPRPAAPDPVGFEHVLTRLTQASKPLLMIGRVSRDEADWARRVRLAELLGARVLTDFKTGAAFPTAHPAHATPASFFATPAALAEMVGADAILALDWIDLGGTLKAAFGAAPSTAFLAHASLDATLHNGFGAEHGGLAGLDECLLCDPDALVALLVERLAAAGHGTTVPMPMPMPMPVERSQPAADAPPATDTADGVSMPAFAAAIAEFLDAQHPVCLARTNLGWPTDAWRFRHPLDYLGYDGGGGIGSGPGMAVGAALALRDTTRLPVAVLGDGDFLMGATALWTAVRYRIPLLLVVANNRSYYNDEVHQEKVARVRDRPVENKHVGQRIEGPVVDLAALARAQGTSAWGPVKTREQLTAVLADALVAVRAGGVAVVDCWVGREYAPAMQATLGRS